MSIRKYDWERLVKGAALGSAFLSIISLGMFFNGLSFNFIIFQLILLGLCPSILLYMLKELNIVKISED